MKEKINPLVKQLKGEANILFFFYFDDFPNKSSATHDTLRDTGLSFLSSFIWADDDEEGLHLDLDPEMASSVTSSTAVRHSLSCNTGVYFSQQLHK